MYFYEIIEQILSEKNLSIPDAARLCGLSDGTIRSMIVRKNKSVTIEVAFRLASGLNVSLERLNGMKELEEDKIELKSEDEDTDKIELIDNYDKMNEAGKNALLSHSRLLLKDDQYLSCGQFDLGKYA